MNYLFKIISILWKQITLSKSALSHAKTFIFSAVSTVARNTKAKSPTQNKTYIYILQETGINICH